MMLVLAVFGQELFRLDFDFGPPAAVRESEPPESEHSVVDRHSGIFEFGYRSPLTPRPVPSEIEARR